MPSVIGCRGSAVFRSASPQGRGPQARLVRAQLRAAHDVVLLGVAPRVLLRRRSVEPHDALAVVVHEAQERGIRLGAEPDGLVVIAVATLEDDDHDVVLVDDLRAETARVLDDPHAEPPGVFEQRRQPLVVLAEAAVLVVVLDRHVSREDQDVQQGHAFAPFSARRASARWSRVMVVGSSSSHSCPPHSLHSVPLKPGAAQQRREVADRTAHAVVGVVEIPELQVERADPGQHVGDHAGIRSPEPHEHVHVERVDGCRHPARAQQVDDRAHGRGVAPVDAAACR